MVNSCSPASALSLLPYENGFLFAQSLTGKSSIILTNTHISQGFGDGYFYWLKNTA
jgi:hypothetical protein